MSKVQLEVSTRRQTVAQTTPAPTAKLRSHVYLPVALLLALISGLLVAAYYLNHPQPEQYLDTGEYMSLVQLIQTQGHIVDPHRVPGFPLLIAGVYALTGQGNVAAVSILHAVLFVLATVEIYLIALLLLRNTWTALAIGLLVGTNITLLTFVKPVLSETLSLWLLVSLALTTVLFLQTARTRYLWLTALLAFALLMTRGEWMYLPIPLFAYGLWMAYRQRKLTRRLLVHALASLIALYAIVGGYIFINATYYGYAGLADTQNFNFWGKIIQYDMQNEAPPQYAAITKITSDFRAQGGLNPYSLVQQHPALGQDHYRLVGEYAKSIILRHPLEFGAKSVPVAFSSLTDFYYESQIEPEGMLGFQLLRWQSFDAVLYKLNMFFPLCAIAWLCLLFWWPTANLPAVQAMGVLVLCILYGLITTTLAGFASYPRYHTPFNPLLIVVVWGSVLAVVLLAVRHQIRLNRQ